MGEQGEVGASSVLRSLVQRLWALRFRNEILALAALLGIVPLLPLVSASGPSSVPIEIWVLGLVPGATLAMQSVGVVLVYRSNGFINFGQIFLGQIAAAFFVLFANYQPLYRIIRNACNSCIRGDTTRGQFLFNYWLGLAIAVGGAVLLAWLMYVLVVKRFERRSRLIVTVASIFIGPVAAFITGTLVNSLTSVQQREEGTLAALAPLPWDWSFDLGAAVFGLSDVLTVGIGVVTVVVLAMYLRMSSIGMAIRASADNAPRAELLGVNTTKIHTRVWFIVGFLSGIPALLGTMGNDPVQYGGITTDGMVRILLVAVIARFVSLPMAGAAALVIGVLQSGVLWSFNGSTAPFDGSLVVLVAGLLLLRTREPASRADALASTNVTATREARPTPSALRDIPVVRTTGRWLGGLLALVLLALPWALSPGQTNLAAIPFIFGIVGLSLLILSGWAGQISLGQFAFAAIGGWVVAVWDVPFVISLLGAAIAGAVVAGLVGIPALRLPGFYLAISTLALAVSVSTIVVSPRYLGSLVPNTLARPAIFGLSLEDQRTFYYACLAMLILTVVVVRGLRYSRTGRVLIAARENEHAVQSFGVSLVRARLVAFALSGFLAAFAGGLFAFHQHGLPLDSFNEQQSIDVFVLTVVGGLGSIAGPLIGVTYDGILTVFNTSPVVQAFFVGFGGLLLLLVAPGGLSQVFYGLRDAFLRRVAKRHRIIVPSLLADEKADRQDGRAALHPNVRDSGTKVFVPRRYGLERQWALATDVEQTRSAEDDFQGLTLGQQAMELVDD